MDLRKADPGWSPLTGLFLEYLMRCPEWSHFQLSNPFPECGGDVLEFQISVLDKECSGCVVCSRSFWKLTNRRPVETCMFGITKTYPVVIQTAPPFHISPRHTSVISVGVSKTVDGGHCSASVLVLFPVCVCVCVCVFVFVCIAGCTIMHVHMDGCQSEILGVFLL